MFVQEFDTLSMKALLCSHLRQYLWYLCHPTLSSPQCLLLVLKEVLSYALEAAYSNFHQILASCMMYKLTFHREPQKLHICLQTLDLNQK